MLKKVTLFVTLWCLLWAVTAHAGKGYDGKMALAPCDTCEYRFTSEELTFTGDSADTSTHVFFFNSGGIAAKTIEVGFKVHKENGESLYVDTVAFYVTYDVLDITTVADDNSGLWLHYHIRLLDTATFSENDSVFAIKVSFPDCREPLDSLQIEFRDTTSYVNQFDDLEHNFYTPTNWTDSYRWYREPNACLSLLKTPWPIGYIVDSNYVSGTARVIMYLESANFNYVDGYVCTLMFNPNLNFDYIDTSQYSGNPTIDTVNDTTIVFSLSSFSGDAPVESPHVYDTFMIVHYTIDTAAAADTKYKVWLQGDYVFSGCDSAYADTNNSTSESAYVKTHKEWVSVKLTTGSIVVGDTVPYRFYAKNSAPIYTDNPTQDINASFTYDEGSLSHTAYVSIPNSFIYNGSGELFWRDDPLANGDTVRIHESSGNTSSEILASLTFYDTIGYWEIRGISQGTDDYNFGDTLNYFVIKYTETTLEPDSVVDGHGYGDLELIEGLVSVTTGGGGGGCPTLYTWHGSGYVLENPILTHSQGKVNPQPADDYYPMTLGIVPEDGFYKIQIRENGKEISIIDQVELVVVDYPLESKIGVSSEGEVFTYQRSIEPIVAVDEWGRDLMPYVGTLDGVWMDVDYPGSMILTYPNQFYGMESYSFALDGEPPPPPRKRKIRVDSTGSDGENIIAEIEDIDGNWYYLGAIPPREYQSENSKWLFDSYNAELGETFRVRITWKVTYQADLQALQLNDNSYFMEHRLSPQTGEHSALGRVAVQLANVDGDVLTLKPGEKIELEFKIPAGTGMKGYARKFFLHSHGYYKTFTPDDLLPKEYALYHNYPNPFNPTTTINFSVPVGGKISLAVYNMLGQEVKSLYDGWLEAGNHQVMWESDNNAGEPVASGVYFYRLRAGDFDESRKMTLLK